jgi:ketosteroid isomerase-like protein
MDTIREKNIALVRNGINKFISGNIPGLLEDLNEDVVWNSFENQKVPYAHAYRGKAATGEFFKEIGNDVVFNDFTPENFYGDGDMVFVKTHQAATVKSTGRKYDHEMLLSFKIRNGKISECFAYVDSADIEKAYLKS